MTAETGEQPEPWEQQTGEPKKMFDQFTAYLHARRPRSLRVTAEQLQLHPVTVRKNAAKWGWVGRATGYDRQMDETYAAAFTQARQRAAQEDMAILDAMRRITAKHLKDAGNSELDELTKLARWIDTHMKHTRTLYGDPTANVVVTGPSGGPVVVEVASFAELSPDQQAVRLNAVADRALRRAAALQALTPGDSP